MEGQSRTVSGGPRALQIYVKVFMLLILGTVLDAVKRFFEPSRIRTRGHRVKAGCFRPLSYGPVGSHSSLIASRMVLKAAKAAFSSGVAGLSVSVLK